MKRRAFITLIGGAAVWPLAARAQQTKPVVWLLAGGTAKAYAPLLSAFLQGLNERLTDPLNSNLQLISPPPRHLGSLFRTSCLRPLTK